MCTEYGAILPKLVLIGLYGFMKIYLCLYIQFVFVQNEAVSPSYIELSHVSIWVNTCVLFS